MSKHRIHTRFYGDPMVVVKPSTGLSGLSDPFAFSVACVFDGVLQLMAGPLSFLQNPPAKKQRDAKEEGPRTDQGENP